MPSGEGQGEELHLVAHLGQRDDEKRGPERGQPGVGTSGRASYRSAAAFISRVQQAVADDPAWRARFYAGTRLRRRGRGAAR
jgi:hypothetical protein